LSWPTWLLYKEWKDKIWVWKIIKKKTKMCYIAKQYKLLVTNKLQIGWYWQSEEVSSLLGQAVCGVIYYKFKYV